jgi:hypothetical protein
VGVAECDRLRERRIGIVRPTGARLREREIDETRDVVRIERRELRVRVDRRRVVPETAGRKRDAGKRFRIFRIECRNRAIAGQRIAPFLAIARRIRAKERQERRALPARPRARERGDRAVP